MADKALDARDAERETVEGLMQLPPPEHVRNINYDTHVGYAPQRPYARLEDRLGQAGNGWASYEELAAALPDGEEIHKRPDGIWVREIWVHTGESTIDAHGVLHNIQEQRERLVALTLAQAKMMTGQGNEADYWNGATWIRRGQKPERDGNVARSGPERKTRLERAAPADQARVQQVAAQQATVAAANVVEMPAHVEPAKEKK